MLFERKVQESTIESYLLTLVKLERGMSIKLRFMRGWPDRIVLLPGGILAFIELKRPKGGEFEPLQLRTHAMLRRLGFKVFTCYTKAEVATTIQFLVGGL